MTHPVYTSPTGKVPRWEISYCNDTDPSLIRFVKHGRTTKLLDQVARWHHGNGSGGPSTPKTEIVPKPQYSGGYISLDGAQPFRVRGRLQPFPDELDAYTYQRGPQGGTPNPPPEVP